MESTYPHRRRGGEAHAPVGDLEADVSEAVVPNLLEVLRSRVVEQAAAAADSRTWCRCDAGGAFKVLGDGFADGTHAYALGAHADVAMRH